MAVTLDVTGPSADSLSRVRATLRDTIEVARVMLVVGLVFLHYFNFPNDTRPAFQGMDPHQNQIATFINGFLTFFFFSAVPLLSAVSGWLFFGGGAEFGRAIGRRIRGRVRSLLLPLLLWNLLTLGLALLAQQFLPTSGFAQQFSVHGATAGVWEYANALLGLTSLPIAFQFWFVRDLFVTVLCSPLLWLMLRHMPFAGAALLAAAWAGGFTLGIFIRTDVVLFFYLGALLRRHGADPYVGARPTAMLLAAYAALVALRSLAPLAVDLGDPLQAAWVDVATRLMRPLGVVACWGLCVQLAASRFAGPLASFGGFAFFLHAAHYPVIALVKDVLWRMTPDANEPWLLVHYMASVVLTIGIVWLGALVIFRLSPRLYALLAGGRRLA